MSCSTASRTSPANTALWLPLPSSPPQVPPNKNVIQEGPNDLLVLSLPMVLPFPYPVCNLGSSHHVGFGCSLRSPGSTREHQFPYGEPLVSLQHKPEPSPKVSANLLWQKGQAASLVLPQQSLGPLFLLCCPRGAAGAKMSPSLHLTCQTPPAPNMGLSETQPAHPAPPGCLRRYSVHQQQDSRKHFISTPSVTPWPLARSPQTRQG